MFVPTSRSMQRPLGVSSQWLFYFASTLGRRLVFDVFEVILVVSDISQAPLPVAVVLLQIF